MRSARLAWAMALRQARLGDADALDVVELDSQTGHHEAASVRAFGLTARTALSPSGGPFAQNPFFCSGLINAAEAVLQVAGDAGQVQVAGARRFETLSYIEAISRRLEVMDSTALSLCMENDLPIIVFDLAAPNSIVRAIRGEKIGTVVASGQSVLAGATSSVE